MKTAPVLAKKKKAILMVDDHPLLRDGLSKVINQQEDLAVCCEAGNAREALAALGKGSPDVAIIDLTLEEGNGLDLIQDIHKRFPKLPILVLSMHHEDLYAERAIRAGARGYVMKREPVGRVIDALRKLLAGHLAFSEDIVARLLAHPGARKKSSPASPAERLSNRELDVFRLLGQGLGTRQASAKLRLAFSTVESYRASIKRKLGISSATELVARAVRFVEDETGG